MRRNIRLFMLEHPVRLTLMERFFARMWHPGLTISPINFRPALAGLLIVLLLGGGTSYAAADALPGDLLYPIKTGVNENVQEALAFSEEAKADLNGKLAVRRLEEAEVLASEGRLSPEVRADIEVRFEEHAEKFETTIASLAEKNDTVEAVADAQSNMETSLKVHAAVLADLTSAGSEVEKGISPIVQVVEKRARRVESARIATEQTILKKVGRGIETAAAAKKRSAEQELSSRTTSREQSDIREVATMAMKAASEAGMSTTSDEALDEFDAGSEKFDEGKYGEAFTKFQSALRVMKRAELDTEVRKGLKIETNFAPPTATSSEEDAEEDRGKENDTQSNKGSGKDTSFKTTPLPERMED